MPCLNCGNEWTYVSKSNQKTHLCEKCYKERKKKVIVYHSIQDKALSYLEQRDVNNAIKCLEECIYKRNETGGYLGNLGYGHHYFANIFLPNLINILKKNRNTSPKKLVDLWNTEFNKLDE